MTSAKEIKRHQSEAVQSLVSAEGPIGKNALEDIFSALEAPFKEENFREGAGLSSLQVDQLVRAVQEQHSYEERGGFLCTVKFNSRFWPTLVPSEKLTEEASRSVATLITTSLANKDFIGKNRCLIIANLLQFVNQLLIYSLVDEEAVMMVYDALLQHLDDEKIQKTLCEILCHLTVAANARLSCDVVKQWRVNRVFAVRNRVGSFSEIDFLLNIYQITKPDYFPKAFNTRHPGNSFGKRRFTKSVRQIQESFELVWPNQAYRGSSGVVNTEGEKGVFRKTALGKLSLNLGHYLMDAIPQEGSLLPSLSPESSGKQLKNRHESENDEEEELAEAKPPTTIQITSLKSVADLIEGMQKLELPSQALALIRNDFTMLILLFHQDEFLLKERLSITLYYTLHSNFLSESRKRHKQNPASVARKKRLLGRVERLQDFFQQGVPVVGRFLSEYLNEGWNGRDYFSELMKLMVYLPIADFEEIFDCLLSPLHHHYIHSYNTMDRLRVLYFLHKLILHWVYVEYERCLQNLGKNPDGTRVREATRVSKGSRRRKSSMMLLPPPSTHTRILNVFPANAFECASPLKSLVDLIEMMGQWVDMAMSGGTCKFSPHHRPYTETAAYEDKSSLEAGRLETHVFVGEVLSYYQVIAQALVSKKVPVVPQLPMSIIHHSMFSQSSNLLASTLWYLCQVKKSVNPMAEARKRDFAAQKDTGPESLVSEQLRKQDVMNASTRDMLSILCQEPVDKNSSLSLFKSEWAVAGSAVFDELALETHPAMIGHLVQFKAESPHSLVDWKTFMTRLRQSDSVFTAFTSYLKNKEPKVVEFFDTFLKPRNADSAADNESQISKGRHSTVTRSSGIGTLRSY